MGERVRIKSFTRAGAVGTHDRLSETIERARALESEGRVAEYRLGGEQTVIVLPVLCLAIYEVDVLTELSPCVVDEGTYTVYDGLATFETDGSAPTPFDRSERETA